MIWLYTQDSEKEIWIDENSWYKSNPGLGKIKKWSFLRQMVEEARTKSDVKAYVMAKDFNIKQNNAQAWLQPDDIKNELTYDIEELRGTIGIGGADLSETGDLTNARVLIIDSKTKFKYFITMYFIPRSKLEQMNGELKEKYIRWVKDGYLIICDDAEIDQSDVVAWFVSLYKKYKIRVFVAGYDKWQAKAFKKEMQDYGFDIEKIEQGYDLSNAMTSLETDLRAKRVNYNQNPIDIECLENVSAEWNSSGTKRRPIKVQGDQEKKIDGAVTMLICYETLDRYRKDYMDIINRR